MALPFRLMCIVAASLLIALDRANGLQDSYVKRVLGANEMCVNVTRPMGGNTLCPIPAFKVVKDIVYAKQMDAALDMISKAFPAITQECQKTITNLICAMYEATCSADEKYEVRLVNYQDCIDYLSCTPNKILPEGSKIGVCRENPDGTAAIVKGPDFAIEEKPKATSASAHVLQSVLNLVGSVLLFIAFS